VLGKSMIGAIYQGGQFSVHATNQTARALSCYAVGLAGYSALKVIGPAFYALNDARTPMLVSLASILMNYAAASYMSARFGFAGLALSTSITAMFGAIVLFLLLRHRTQGVYGRDLMASTLRIVAASAAMGVVVYASNAWIGGHLPARRLTYLADLAISVPLGVAVFYAACRALRVSELALVTRAIPLSGRLRRTDNR